MTVQLSQEMHAGVPPRRRHAGDYGLLFLMVLPNLVWALLDRGMWASDACLYGIGALHLHQALKLDLPGWWSEMLAVGPKPPLLPWVGQFFVPVGILIGNIDSGLLLANTIAQYVTLVLLYRAFIELLVRRQAALLGTLAVAATPSFTVVTTQYYAQAGQFVAVAWFVYIMAHVGKWDRFHGLVQIVAAGAFSVLSMLSSPVLFVVPALVSAQRLRRRGVSRRRGIRAAAVAGALVLLIPTLLWYAKNLERTVEYAQFAFNYHFGGVSGGAYPAKCAVWTSFFLSGAFVPLSILLLVAAGVMRVRAMVRNKTLSGSSDGEQAVMAAGLQLVIAIGILSLSAQQERRYVLPLMGYYGLIVGWLLLEMKSRSWRAALWCAVALQLTVVKAGAFGLIDQAWWETRVLQTERERRFELMDRIDGLGGEGREGDVLLAVGGLDFYSLELEYHAAKKWGPDRRQRRYDCVEFMLTRPEIDGDVERAWKEAMKNRPTYIVILNRTLRAQQRSRADGNAHGWSAVVKGALDISERVASCAQYKPLPSPGARELEIYRHVGGDL